MKGVIPMTALQKFNCPCCGNVVMLDMDDPMTVCASCETEFDSASVQAYLADVTEPKQDDMTWDYSEVVSWRLRELAEMNVYTCGRCGEFLLNEHDDASVCPICNCELERKGKMSGKLRPDLIIPFKLDRSAATKRLQKRMNRIKLLPKIFKEEKRLEEVKGVYIPVWFFRTDAQGKLICKGTQVRNRSNSESDNISTAHYHISRTGTVHFPGVTAMGSSKIEDRLVNDLESFDLRDAVEFRSAHLADYFVLQCDVEAEECVSSVNDRIKAHTEAALQKTIGDYTNVARQSFTLSLQNSSAKCVWCPVWFWSTTWKRKRYTVTINGQTGKMAGNLPVDRKAFLKWYFCLFGIAATVCFLAGWLLWLV